LELQEKRKAWRELLRRRGLSPADIEAEIRRQEAEEERKGDEAIRRKHLARYLAGEGMAAKRAAIRDRHGPDVEAEFVRHAERLFFAHCDTDEAAAGRVEAEWKETFRRLTRPAPAKPDFSDFDDLPPQ